MRLKLPAKLRYKIKEEWKTWAISLKRFKFKDEEIGYKIIEIIDSDGDKVKEFKTMKKDNCIVINFEKPTSGTAIFELYKKRKGWLL